MKPHIEGNSEEIKFYNSVYYTDLQLGKFIETLENGGMLKNTLVIIVADHGFQYPGNLSYNSYNKFHIPMIWCGGALALSDTTISTISSQTDIANTLLTQMGIATDQFQYSKNSLAENAPGKIVYEINNGFGYVSDSLVYYYYLQSDKFVAEHGQLNEGILPVFI
jgi:phosphoglycerol transferase MdoB-like AlkP superfamily enzyme